MTTIAKEQTISIPAWPNSLFVLGNTSIINLPLTGFFCSQQFPAKAVLPIYDWAHEARNNKECIIGGFHSSLENDVLNILLRGEQPLIWVPARGLPKRLPSNIKDALTKEKLLIVSPFPSTIKRPKKKTAIVRNQFILTIAKKVVVGYVTPNGNLAKAINQIPTSIQYITSES